MSLTLNRLLAHLNPEHRAHAVSLLRAANPVDWAGNPQATAAELTDLAQHENFRVRAAVAYNPNCPKVVRAKLKKDTSTLVRNAAAGKLTDQAAEAHLGAMGGLAGVGAMYPWNQQDKVATALAVYGSDPVDAALMRNCGTWLEVVDYVMHRAASHTRPELVAAFCERHGTLLRDLRATRADHEDNWATRQIDAALAQTPEELKPFLNDPDIDVALQALHNPNATADDISAAVSDTDIEMLVPVAERLTRSVMAHTPDLLSDIHRTVAEAIGIDVRPDGTWDIPHEDLIRNCDGNDLVITLAPLPHDMLAELVEAGSEPTWNALAARNDLPRDIARAVLTHSMQDNRHDTALAALTALDSNYDDVPWAVLHIARDPNGSLDPVAAGVAAALNALPVQALDTVYALDTEFVGTVAEMMAAAQKL